MDHIVPLSYTTRVIDRQKHTLYMQHQLLKCFKTNEDVNIALFQIRLTPTGPGLPKSCSNTVEHGGIRNPNKSQQATNSLQSC